MRAAVLLCSSGLLIVALGGCSDRPVAGVRRGIPAQMAAAGDSITRAFDVGVCCILSDSPDRSWATGDSIDSHYTRLRRMAGSTVVREYNVARSGARMDELERQLRAAAAFPVDYVTVMMGANDLCTSSAATMTSPADFEARFSRALTALTSLRPQARVFVTSIPNVNQLWSLLHGDARAQKAWDRYHICPSVLASSRTVAERGAVAARERQFNAILARVCGKFRACRYDGGATFGFRFTPADVSPVDYYHPSERGQRSLAALTWRASYWGKAS